MMTTSTLIVDPSAADTHPSYQSVTDMLNTWIELGQQVAEVSRPSRIASRLGARSKVLAPLPEHATLLLPLMGPRLGWVPKIPKGVPLALYCWDVWPSNRSAWAAVFARASPSQVMMTSRDAVIEWSAWLPCPVTWIPDATVVDRFRPSKALSERSIDVLELGRRSEAFHSAITTRLEEGEFVHLYQGLTEGLVFSTQQAMIDGVCDSKIVVCFPGSETHPEKYGTYATVTQRYFEVMAAGCIPVGSAPADLIEMMGYDPVVPVNALDPFDTVSMILESLPEFEPLVERNLQRVSEIGDWSVRLSTMARQLGSSA